MRTGVPVFAGLLALAAGVGRADPTWPAPTDEMEEIIYQLQGFKGRLFNDQIVPCNNEAAGPGRVTASEWLRIAFQYVDYIWLVLFCVWSLSVKGRSRGVGWLKGIDLQPWCAVDIWFGSWNCASIPRPQGETPENR